MNTFMYTLYLTFGCQMEAHKKKIAHVQVIPHLTGVQQVSIDILSALSDNYDKYIIFGGGYKVKKGFLKLLSDNDITPIFLPSLKREIGFHDIAATKELYKVFKRYEFDIIHTNSTKPGIVARLAAKLAGCSFIVHTVHGIAYHQFESIGKRGIYYAIEAFFSLFSDRLVSVNNFYLKYYPFIRNKTCIHNSVEMNNVCISSRESIHFLRLGYLARLDKQKDPLTLLKSVQYGIENNYFSRTSLSVLIGGEGELSQVCRDYVIENQLSDVISFAGWISDKQSFYNQIDVFCLPSIFEAFGLVFLEAAHFNIPSISTEVEGVPEVVINNETGLLVKPKDYKEMAKKIKLYLDDAELVKTHGESAKERMKRNFSKQDMLVKYRNIYETK